jgi:hypothetical protein
MGTEILYSVSFMFWQGAIPITDGKTFRTLAVPVGLVRTVLTVNSNNRKQHVAI